MELLLVKDIKSTIQVCLNSICTFVYGEYARGEGDWGRLKGEGGGALTLPLASLTESALTSLTESILEVLADLKRRSYQLRLGVKIVQDRIA